MDGFDRIYDLHKILKDRRSAIPLKDILSQMECSRATFNRIKRHMMDFLGAPIEYSREHGGYQYGEGHYELPGIWFNEQELHALVIMHGLLSHSQTGLLGEQLEPVRKKFDQLLSKSQVSPAVLNNKVVLVNAMTRPVTHQYFELIASALIKEAVLDIEYQARTNDEVSQRSISPQRLVCYRGNWYLDAWCHLRQALRTFALENILSSQLSNAQFHLVESAELDKHVKPTYGIYAGVANAFAELKFSLDVACKVKREVWHPDQKMRLLESGEVILEIPFDESLPDELIQDILRYGADVCVLAPESLRDALRREIHKMVACYAK